MRESTQQWQSIFQCIQSEIELRPFGPVCWFQTSTCTISIKNKKRSEGEKRIKEEKRTKREKRIEISLAYLACLVQAGMMLPSRSYDIKKNTLFIAIIIKFSLFLLEYSLTIIFNYQFYHKYMLKNHSNNLMKFQKIMKDTFNSQHNASTFIALGDSFKIYRKFLDRQVSNC